MAVAGLVIMTVREAFAAVREQLTAHPQMTDIESMEEQCKVVAVLETDADKVEQSMTQCLGWEGVLSVDLAFISYEDELAAGKGIPCPPHKGQTPPTARARTRLL